MRVSRCQLFVWVSGLFRSQVHHHQDASSRSKRVVLSQQVRNCLTNEVSSCASPTLDKVIKLLNGHYVYLKRVFCVLSLVHIIRSRLAWSSFLKSGHSMLLSLNVISTTFPTMHILCYPGVPMSKE